MTEPLSTVQPFLIKLTNIVIANLSNENFGVKELARQSGLSLYTVSRRLYSIKKIRASQFIREIRLEKAMEMLRNGENTASEVSYMVGFGSPAYFNKCFREFFGYTPGEVKKLDQNTHFPNELIPNAYESKKRINARKVFFLTHPGIMILIMLAVIIIFLIYRRFSNSIVSDDMVSDSDGRIAIAVMPFRNLTNDTVWDVFQELIQQNLISSLSNNRELKVRHKESINSLIFSGGLTQYTSISPEIAGRISQKLETILFVYGNIENFRTAISIDAQLINSKTKNVLASFKIVKPSKIETVSEIVDSLSKQLQNFLLVSKMIKENRGLQHEFTPSGSAEAMRYFLYGVYAREKGNFQGAIDWCQKALAVDSNFITAAFLLENSYSGNGESEQSLKWLVKNFRKRYQLAYYDQLHASWAYAFSFESPSDQILYLKQLQEFDDQEPNNYYLLGITYNLINQYEKAIPELERNLDICRRWGKEFMKNNSAYTELGLAYQMTGQYKKARRIYKESEKYIPGDGPTLYRQALLSFAEKDSVTADRYVKKYVYTLKNKYSASDWHIARREAELYYEANFINIASEFYRKALLLNPEDPELLEEFAGFLARDKGNTDEFMAISDKALRLAPNQFDYYKYLDSKGWGLYKLGRSKEAFEILKKVLDSAPFKLYKYKFHLEQVENTLAEQK